MSAIIEQLQLDQTFFVQLGVIFVLFFVLTQVYFKPFMVLFEKRHQKTTEDSKKATEILSQVKLQIAEYEAKLDEARTEAKKEYEALMADAKRQEAAMLAQARAEAKAIVQQSQDELERSRQQIKAQLEMEVEGFAQKVADSLLAR